MKKQFFKKVDFSLDLFSEKWNSNSTMQDPACSYSVYTPKIKLLLWERRITLCSLAKKWGCHESTVGRVVSGHIKDPRWLEKLAAALEVPLSEITTQEGETYDRLRPVSPRHTAPKKPPRATAKTAQH